MNKHTIVTAERAMLNHSYNSNANRCLCGQDMPVEQHLPHMIRCMIAAVTDGKVEEGMVDGACEAYAKHHLPNAHEIARGADEWTCAGCGWQVRPGSGPFLEHRVSETLVAALGD